MPLAKVNPGACTQHRLWEPGRVPAPSALAPTGCDQDRGRALVPQRVWHHTMLRRQLRSAEAEGLGKHHPWVRW